MRYEQAKPLVDKLIDIAILYHAAPSMLRTKIYDALDEYLPDMDEGCRERGCIAVDNFKEKKMTEDKEYEEISRRYLERAKKHTEELQAKWKEAMDKAIAFQEALEKQAKEKNT